MFTENLKYFHKRKIQFKHKNYSSVSFYENFSNSKLQKLVIWKFGTQGYWLENHLFKVRFRFGFGDFSVFGFGFGSIMKSWVRSLRTTKVKYATISLKWFCFLIATLCNNDFLFTKENQSGFEKQIIKKPITICFDVERSILWSKE